MNFINIKCLTKGKKIMYLIFHSEPVFIRALSSKEQYRAGIGGNP
jgi:hypothetical protein